MTFKAKRIQNTSEFIDYTTNNNGNFSVNIKNELYNPNCPNGIYNRVYPNFRLFTTKSPHSNCQTYFIASFYLLFNYAVENKLDILKDIQKYCSGGKRQLLLDINQKWKTQTRDIFDNDIIFEQDYTSTNGSNMCIILTKTTKLMQL